MAHAKLFIIAVCSWLVSVIIVQQSYTLRQAENTATGMFLSIVLGFIITVVIYILFL